LSLHNGLHFPLPLRISSLSSYFVGLRAIGSFQWEGTFWFFTIDQIVINTPFLKGKLKAW